MSLGSNLITGGLGPGGNTVLGGLGGTLVPISATQVCSTDCLRAKVRSPASSCPPGYWGRNIHRRILCENTISRTRALLQDQLLAGGLVSDLWIGVVDPAGVLQLRGSTEIMPGIQECSCVKQSSKQTDRKCQSCYGQRFMPGYAKFGYRTYYISSVNTDLTLSNLEIDTSIKPNRLKLSSSSISGTAETPDYPFYHDASDGSVWEEESVSIIDDANQSSVLVEFSTDVGITWYPLSSIGAINPTGSGSIRFKVTITRDTIQILSPLFEILRARTPIIERSEDGRCGPSILILKNITAHTRRKTVHGIVEEQQGPKFWTGPLAFFDPSIQTYSKDEALRENIFIEIKEGMESGARWAVYNWSLSDPLGMMTRQYFDARKAIENDFYDLVF